MNNMKNNDKISFIIPVHEYNEVIKEYLSLALDSIAFQKEYENSDVVIVAHKSIKNEINSFVYDKINFNLIINDGKIDYQSQVNLGVKNIKNDYFTVIEFDDEINLCFIKNGYEHINYYSDVDVFVGCIVETDENYNAIRFLNEVSWSRQIVGESGQLGFTTKEMLKHYTDFRLSGAIIKKDVFVNVGMYKEKIKLTFMFELLLRMLNNGKKIYTIPKLMYRHLKHREGSYTDNILKEMSLIERKFWFDTAIKESNYNTDRDVDISMIYGDK